MSVPFEEGFWLFGHLSFFSWQGLFGTSSPLFRLRPESFCARASKAFFPFFFFSRTLVLDF